MPDHPLCPPHSLPPTPCEDFFYCPDPMSLTDEQRDALFPREQRIALIRDTYRNLARTRLATDTQHTPAAAGVLKGVAHGQS